MDIEKIKNIINCIANRYYYNFNLNVGSNSIIIKFTETKYSHLRSDQYFEMLEEIIYDDYIIAYKTKLSESRIFIFKPNESNCPD